MYNVNNVYAQNTNGRQNRIGIKPAFDNSHRMPRPPSSSDLDTETSAAMGSGILAWIRNLPVELMNLLEKTKAVGSVMQAFVKGQETDENKLTNILFYAINPSIAVGSKITGKTQADQWLELRDKVIRVLMRDPSVSVLPYLREPTTDGCGILDRFDPKRDLTKGKEGARFKLIKKRDRDLAKVTGVVLHHMAFSRGNNVDKYLEVGAHFVVMHDGTIARLYPNAYYLNASNGFNPTTVAIEFAGNTPKEDWTWWEGTSSRNYVSPAQINAGRCLMQQLSQELPNLRHVYAHRQSTTKSGDPGQDIWLGVAEWAINRLGLTDIGSKGEKKIDDGLPIPASWRVVRTKPIVKELEFPAATSQLSGVHWVNQFPGSRSINNLVQPFRSNVQNFYNALIAAGATVTINATLRPPKRAYLMHYAYKIARASFNPQVVPPMAGVNINWWHGTLAASKAAAKAMVQAYGIVYQPALSSRHTQGRAIDMTISWSGNLVIAKQNGQKVTIKSSPRTGSDNSELHQVGASYSVIKLLPDAPHWSDDGH